MQVLTEPGSDRLLGATIVAPHAGEMLSEFVLAMRWGLGLNKILSTVHAYPTWSEANKRVAGVWRQNRSQSGRSISYSATLLGVEARPSEWCVIGKRSSD